MTAAVLHTGDKLSWPRHNYIAALKFLHKEALAWVSEFESNMGEDDGNGIFVGQNVKGLQALFPRGKTLLGVDLSEHIRFIEVMCVCVLYLRFCY